MFNRGDIIKYINKFDNQYSFGRIKIVRPLENRYDVINWHTGIVIAWLHSLDMQPITKIGKYLYE